MIKTAGTARKNTAQMYIGKAQDIAIDQKSKNSIRGIIKNKGEKKQKQMVCVLCAERSHVGTDQNVMSVISGRNGMTVQNMTEGERGGKITANAIFAGKMLSLAKKYAQITTNA